MRQPFPGQRRSAQRRPGRPGSYSPTPTTLTSTSRPRGIRADVCEARFFQPKTVARGVNFLKPTSAHNLCKALQGVIWRREGGTIQLVEYRRMRWESGIPLPTMAFNFPPKTRIDFRIETPVLTNGFLIETKTRSRIEQLISITSPVEIR